MKRLVKRVVNSTLVPLIEYVLARVRVPRDSVFSGCSVSQYSVVNEVLRRAVADSADYADNHMQDALCIRGDKEALWRQAFAARSPGGLVLETESFVAIRSASSLR
jgi:hypothetical protein